MKYLLFFVFLCISSVADSSTSAFAGEKGIRGIVERIYVRDLLSGGEALRSSLPVEVNQSPTTIEVIFLCEMGKQSITVTDAQGNTVFTQTVNVANLSTLKINTTGWAKGNYSIRIAGTNTLYGGEFQIQ